VDGERKSRPPVLHDIVKRRFVRVPRSESGPGRSITFRRWSGDDGCGPSPWTLNPRHMMGLPNRDPRTDLEKLVFLCQFH
jgi:hypothetical protein